MIDNNNNNNNNNIPTPEEFARMMKNQTTCDKESAHLAMDDLMVELLRRLGYGESMDIFEKQPKWYA